MSEIYKDVVIVGGGIAGIATAVALKKVGVESLVLEKADELRSTGTALSIFPNAWRALAAIGVDHKLLPLFSPLIKGQVTDVTTGGSVPISFETALERGGKGVRLVIRKVLLETMAEELPSEYIRFNSKVESIDTYTHNGTIFPVLHLQDGTTIKAKVLIGCDGVHSAVANWMGLGDPVQSGRSAVRGLSVYPQGHGHKLLEVQQFVGGDRVRVGFIPLDETQIYWFATFTTVSGEDAAKTDPELIQKMVLEKIAKGFPDIFLDTVRHSEVESLTLAPLLLRKPWELIFRELHKNNATVAGDAMHPMTPDLGQGGCTALEDAVVLARNIAEVVYADGEISPNWGRANEALSKYVSERRWRVAGVTAGAYLSGQVQQGQPNWFSRMLRYTIYKYLFAKIIISLVHYDCGTLSAPKSSFAKLE